MRNVPLHRPITSDPQDHKLTSCFPLHSHYTNHQNMNHENQKITSASTSAIGHTGPKRFIDFAPKTAMSMRHFAVQTTPTSEDTDHSLNINTIIPTLCHLTASTLYIFSLHPQRVYLQCSYCQVTRFSNPIYRITCYSSSHSSWGLKGCLHNEEEGVSSKFSVIQYI